MLSAHLIFYRPLLWMGGLTARVTRKWAGLDSVWEREKLEARKVLEKRAESHLSGARIVRQVCEEEQFGCG